MSSEAGRRSRPAAGMSGRAPLYSAAERARRDASAWTLVQGILTPLQFAVFLVSLGLVLAWLATGGLFAPRAARVAARPGAGAPA